MLCMHRARLSQFECKTRPCGLYVSIDIHYLQRLEKVPAYGFSCLCLSARATMDHCRANEIPLFTAIVVEYLTKQSRLIPFHKIA